MDTTLSYPETIFSAVGTCGSEKLQAIIFLDVEGIFMISWSSINMEFFNYKK